MYTCAPAEFTLLYWLYAIHYNTIGQIHQFYTHEHT